MVKGGKNKTIRLLQKTPYVPGEAMIADQSFPLPFFHLFLRNGIRMMFFKKANQFKIHIIVLISDDARRIRISGNALAPEQTRTHKKAEFFSGPWGSLKRRKIVGVDPFPRKDL